jgi:hypothetical protein
MAMATAGEPRPQTTSAQWWSTPTFQADPLGSGAQRSDFSGAGAIEKEVDPPTGRSLEQQPNGGQIRPME